MEPPASTPSGSDRVFPSIWYPPQTPKITVPLAASFRTEASSPLSRSHWRSSMVFFVPGRITISGSFRSDARCTYRRDTPGILSKGLKSVKLEILGRRITAISMTPTS